MTSPSCPRRTSPATATATRPIAPTPRPCSRPPGTRRSTESPVKSVEQQALSALHRLWQGYLQTRTARINAVRGLLREVGVTIPTGASYVLPRARAALADEPLPPYLCHALGEALEEIATLEARAQAVQDQLTHLAEQLPAVALLQGVPGVGILTATALVAFVGDIQRFRSGRDFAALPRPHPAGALQRAGAPAGRHQQAR